MTRPRLALWATAAALLAGGTIVAVSVADDAAAPPPPTVLEQAAAAGHAWRLETAAGPVHVWAPAGYHADGAATVIYVHGYYTDVDRAWADHRLAQQFALSGLNALFIAPEAPARGRDAVSWPDLTNLLTTVAAAIDLPRPMGATVAIGHSGGYRTVDRWLDAPSLDHVIAVDSTYGDHDDLARWLATSPHHRLIVIGDDTLRWTEALAATLGDEVVTLDRFPDDDEGLPPEARTRRVVYVRSQYGHMPLVTAGVVLPMMLRLIPAEVLPSAPWAEPYGLPPPPIDAGVDARGRR